MRANRLGGILSIALLALLAGNVPLSAAEANAPATAVTLLDDGATRILDNGIVGHVRSPMLEFGEAAFDATKALL